VYDAEEEMHAAAEEPKPADTKKMEDMTSEEIEQILYPKVLPLLTRTHTHIVGLYGTAFKGSSQHLSLSLLCD
jgi:hypothetical protein